MCITQEAKQSERRGESVHIANDRREWVNDLQ